MQFKQKDLKPNHYYIWPLALTATIYCVSSLPTIAAPSVGFSYDKIAHFLVFGLLATALFRVPHFFNKGWKGVWLTVLIVSAYGIVDEFRQLFTEGRSVELNDWIADTGGAITAGILYLKWSWYRTFLEMPCFSQRETVADENTNA